ncbi:MAG: hypothetical protein ACRCW1_01710 [Anaerotignaceae bacterium]
MIGEILGAAQKQIGTAIGLGQAVSGMIGQRKAKKEFLGAFEKQRTYKADPEIQKMLEMRRGRLGMGLGSASRQMAEQGIASSAAQATSAAQQMGRGAGLSAIGAIQKQSQRGATQLAGMEEQAREQNLAGFERAVGAASSERAKQFASESEKEQARTAIKGEQLAAKRAAISQGLSGAIGSATGVAMSGTEGADFSKFKRPKKSSGIEGMDYSKM